ncbi:MAG TPA: zinc-binding dehydrogenase [Spirochaetota bacterium]|nr:zinc-binding dehydrogenase [Spirochaetota bacterium]HOS41975.1 zinc-binding dehydrogenase [Spirochaetota bacterium]HPU89763.1 zinc-binding dehydrogenase [Spirochaetota bacterium]
MRAARITAPRTYTITDEPVPKPGKDQVLVRLLKTALCGSDLPYFANDFPAASYPLPFGYPGHECCGTVEESSHQSFKPGMRVMYYPTDLDAFREYHAVDAARLQRLPSEGDLNVLLMTQLLGAVAHCAFRIDSPYNKTVAIMGQGPVGLLFTALMRLLGAKRIIAIDPLDFRRAAGIIMGADMTLDPRADDVPTAVREATGGTLADIVIDAYGQESAVINACFELARHNGQVAFFGICLDEAPGLRFGTFFRKELRMISSVGPDLSMDYPYALDMITRGAVDVRPLITHVMPFERIQDAFDIAVGRRENAIKIILDF